MNTIPQNEALANLPVEELEQAIEQFLQPVTDRLPDQRLTRVVRLAVQGISSSQSPIITQMARGLARTTKTIWAPGCAPWAESWDSRPIWMGVGIRIFSRTDKASREPN